MGEMNIFWATVHTSAKVLTNTLSESVLLLKHYFISRGGTMCYDSIPKMQNHFYFSSAILLPSYSLREYSLRE